jgi:spore coat polysaccharide biosynthesis protein SpsF
LDSRSEQEAFWAGEFGTMYIDRNSSDELVRSNKVFFAKALSSLNASPTSILEVGANIGLNMVALKDLFPNAILTAIEINWDACQQLRSTVHKIFNLSFQEYEAKEKFDLVLIKGVLIHMNPKDLQSSYRKIAASSSKYVLIAEYFNPTPIAIDYRGHKNKLFKRDFVSEFININPEWKIQDYGFVYHGDVFPQDDLTWFLLTHV